VRYEDTDYRHGVSPYSCEAPFVFPITEHTPQSSPSTLRVFHDDSVYPNFFLYSGADKCLARPGRKQATATEDCEFHISYL
jgi:hypothetical protein